MSETKNPSKHTSKKKKGLVSGSENEFQLLYSILVLADIILVIAFGIRLLGEVIIDLDVEFWIIIGIVLILLVDKIKTLLELTYQGIVNTLDFLSQKVLEDRNPG